MGNTQVEPGKENNIGITDDEQGKIMMEEAVNNLKKEIKQFKDRIVDVEKAKENYQVQWDVEDEIYQIKLKEGNYAVVEHKFEFEKDPRYSELLQTMVRYKYRQEVVVAEGQLKQFDTAKVKAQEQLTSARDKLKEITGKGE